MATLLFLPTVDIFSCCHPPQKRTRCIIPVYPYDTRRLLPQLKKFWLEPSCRILSSLFLFVDESVITFQHITLFVLLHYFFFQLIIILFLSVKERSLMKIISGKEHKYISRFSKAKKSPDHRHLLKFANHSASYNILNSHPYLTLGVIFLLTSMCSAKITATWKVTLHCQLPFSQRDIHVAETWGIPRLRR